MAERFTWRVSISGRIDVADDLSTLQDRFLTLLKADDTVKFVLAESPGFPNVVAAIVRIAATEQREMIAIARDAMVRALVAAGRDIMGATPFGWTVQTNYEIETGPQ